MKPLKDSPFLLLVAVGAAIFFGFNGFFAFLVALTVRHTAPVRYTDPWLYFPLIGALASVAVGFFFIRSRGLRYSATTSEFGTALSQKPIVTFADFNDANAHLLRLSLLFYFLVIIPVWIATSYIFASLTTAFVITIAAFIVAHVVRIAQLKELPEFSFGFLLYAGTAFGSVLAVCVGGGAFWYTLTIASFSWKAFWLVALCLVLISCMSVHADFALAKLLHRSTDK